MPPPANTDPIVSRVAPRALLLSGILLLTACGERAETALPPLAAEGREVARSNGCGACHGADGGGGVGPEFVGLFGSTVSLQGGEEATADRDYLVESIVDPSAKLVEGYNLPMPQIDLDDDEIDAIVAYIEALQGTEP